MDAVLRRIEALDDDINAFITVDAEAALAAARHADQRTVSGADLGPLHGVPFSVKDLLDTGGLCTTYGSRAFAHHVPTVDVAAVARMRAAGGILVGKTATPELATSLCTRSELNGITRNPWNLEYSPGGSSGGAGTAVAVGMGPLAVSTDGGGSARVPAAACGVLGLKPTRGRVPHESWPFHFSNNSSVALNTRTVEDMIEMLAIMSGPHPLDPWSRRPSSELDRSQVADGVSWLGDRRMLFIESPAGLTPDRDLLGVLDALLTSLAGAGAEVKRAPGDPTEFDPAMVVRFLTPNLVARARQMSPGKQAMLESPRTSREGRGQFRIRYL